MKIIYIMAVGAVTGKLDDFLVLFEIFLCFGRCCGEKLLTSTHVGFVVRVRRPLGMLVIKITTSLI